MCLAGSVSRLPVRVLRFELSRVCGLPELFSDLGREVLANLRNQVTKHGLTDGEAHGWITQEPTFKKATVSQGTPKPALSKPRDKLTPYPIGGVLPDPALAHET